MWKIIQNEWYSLTRNRILYGICIGFTILLLVTVYLGSKHASSQEKLYIAAKEHLRGKWESIKEMNPHGAAHYGTYVFKPTTLLSGLDDGVNSITGNVLKVEGHVQNEIVHSEASQSQAVSKFGKLKSSLLMQYIVPILIIFLAFQSINNEKQTGRLKLLLIQGVNPARFIIAKTLSVWLLGIGLLIINVAIYLLMNLQGFNFDTSLRLFLFFCSYAFYYFILTALTIYLSILWQNANLALTSMLGVWILWTIFLPNILMSSIEDWHELPSREVFKSAMKDDRSKGIDGHSPSSGRLAALKEKVLEEYGADSLSQLPINFRGIVMQEDEEYGNKVWDKHFGNLRTILKKQKQSYQVAGMINPFISLQNTSKGFAGSDNLHHQNFLVQVEDYRRVFIKTLNDKDAFGGSKTGDRSWKANNEFFRSVPDFKYQPVRLIDVFSHYLIDIIFLLFWCFSVGALLIGKSKKIQVI